MEKLEFKTTIDATPERVWDILWNEKTYGQWTAAFSEGSKATTDWQKGSKVFFTDQTNRGMVSMIAEHIPNEYMSIKHLGNYDNGIEDTESASAKAWSGAMENYTLKNTDGKTELKIDMDITAEFKDMFSSMWPKALANVKALAEA